MVPIGSTLTAVTDAVAAACAGWTGDAPSSSPAANTRASRMTAASRAAAAAVAASATATAAPLPAGAASTSPAAAASSSGSGSASAAQSASDSLRPTVPVSSTTQPCSHSDPTHEHALLPHSPLAGNGFWRDTVRKLKPLADHYEQYARTTARHGQQSQPQPQSSASSSSNSRRVWSRHCCMPCEHPPAPYPSGGFVELLRDVRHPDLEGSMSVKSFTATLDSLHEHDRDHVLNVIMPFAAHLVMRLPELFPLDRTCLPLLVRGIDQSVTLSAAQCASIVAAQFFSLFPPKPTAMSDSADGEDGDCTWPGCNMDVLLSVQRANVMAAKQLMICNYFARIENPAEGITPDRFVTFHRRVVDDKTTECIDDERLLAQCAVPLTPVEFREEGCIEDAAHSLQADFANAYIGGGALYTGCVQEEIRFCLSPECLVSMLLAEAMMENESIAIIGPKMYSRYGGYGSALCFAGDCADERLEADEWGRSSNCIVAVDALDYCHCGGSVPRTPASQWQQPAMMRETLKAYVGYSFPQTSLGSRFRYDTVATGNWGWSVDARGKLRVRCECASADGAGGRVGDRFD